jgi:hypothetical protein
MQRLEIDSNNNNNNNNKNVVTTWDSDFFFARLREQRPLPPQKKTRE